MGLLGDYWDRPGVPDSQMIPDEPVGSGIAEDIQFETDRESVGAPEFHI